MSNVIHVDNSDFFRKLMRTFLVELGFEADSFERGEDALNRVNAGEVSYVITGLELADMDGEEFIKRLTLSRYPVTIIIVTSNEEAVNDKRHEALGVKASILKSGDWKKELRSLLS